MSAATTDASDADARDAATTDAGSRTDAEGGMDRVTEVLLGIMTTRPPADFAHCRTRAETLRVMRRYTAALGLTDPAPEAKDGEAAAPVTGPLTKLRVVHIGGTKGKGSTSAMVESILRSHGLSTGFYSSPHLVSVRERIRLNGRPISEEKFVQYFWECLKLLEPLPTFRAEVGFFRFMTLLAFYVFHREGVDAAVLEVGIGGRLDATNIVPAPLACGVTTLDYDHINVLGDTLGEIAQEKAGIFKAGIPAFTVPQVEEGGVSLAAAAKGHGTHLVVVPPSSLDALAPGGTPPPLGLAGDFQRTNAALAVALARAFLAGNPATPTPPPDALSEATLRGLAAVQWAGRAQVVRVPPAGAGAPELLLAIDGAHTPASMECATRWFRGVVEAEQARIAADAKAEAGAGADAVGGVQQVLLFNCGHTKAPVKLVGQLARLPVLRAVFAPFEFAKPSKRPPPTGEELCARFHAAHGGATTAESRADGAGAEVSAPEAEAGGDPTSTAGAAEGSAGGAGGAGAGAGARAAAAAAAAASGGGGTTSGQFKAPAKPPPLTWQRSLQRLWVCAREHFGGPAESSVAPSIRDAVAGLRTAAYPAGTRTVAVLVTGSLYLVGSTLDAAGWDVDEGKVVRAAVLPAPVGGAAAADC